MEVFLLSELIRNLKTLFKTFIYYKEEDEPNFHKWFNQHILYEDGKLLSVNENVIIQSCTGELTFMKFTNYGETSGPYTGYIYSFSLKVNELNPHQEISLNCNTYEGRLVEVTDEDYSINGDYIKGSVYSSTPLNSIHLILGEYEGSSSFYTGVNKLILYNDDTVPVLVNQKNLVLSREGNNLYLTNLNGLHLNQTVTLKGDMSGSLVCTNLDYGETITFKGAYIYFKNSQPANSVINLSVTEYRDGFTGYSGGNTTLNI